MDIEREVNQIVANKELKDFSRLFRNHAWNLMEEELERITNVPYMDHEEKWMMEKTFQRLEDTTFTNKRAFIVGRVARIANWDGTGDPETFLNETLPGWMENWDLNDPKDVDAIYKAIKDEEEDEGRSRGSM